VKHSRLRRPPSPDPQDFARTVRRDLAASLSGLGYTPATSEFWDRIERFAAALATWGSRINLTAEPHNPAAIVFHLTDSLAPAFLAQRPGGERLAGAFNSERRILDLGSGAGFPALVLAAAMPARFTLVEARRKRASFLTVAANEMRLDNVTIEPLRASGAEHREEFDLVLSRGVGTAAGFHRLASAVLKPGGLAVLYANAGQRIGAAEATACGLADYLEIRYELSRGQDMVARKLATWRRL
jgi:16S rRNA (guanine527-N7)-methyltransferase